MAGLDNLLLEIQKAPELWLGAAVALAGSILLCGLASELVLWMLRGVFRGVDKDTWNSLRDSFKKPLAVFLMLLGIYGTLELLPLSPKTDLLLARGLKIGFILTAAYGAYHLEGVLAALFGKLNARMNLQSSELLKQFSLRVIRFVVAVLAATLVADQFGINAGSIVAGLGIAGLAVALAAQDTLANIFAGIVLIMDKPFDVGELVQVENHTGIVENINFRSTRIRLLTQELVTIPNSAIAKGPITNLTRRNQRKAEVRLELGKGVHRKALLEFIDELEGILRNTDGIDPATVLVRLESYAVTGPVLNLTFMTDTAEWEEYVTIRQEAVLSLMEALERNEIKTARQRVQIETI